MNELEQGRAPSATSRWTEAKQDVRERFRSNARTMFFVALACGTFVVGGGLDRVWALAGYAALTLSLLLAPQRSGADHSSAGMREREQRGLDADGHPIWRSLLIGIPDPVLVLDGTGQVIAVNAAAQSILNAVPGRHLSQITRSPEILAAVNSALTSGDAQKCETRLTVPVGRHLTALATPFRKIERDIGEPALILYLHDLTEQERLARLRADFVANASHELRTPLASLIGFLGTLQGPAKNDDAAREHFIGIMQEQAARMSRLIDELLSLSRIEMREHVPPQDKIDLGDVARTAVMSLQPLAAQLKIVLPLVPETVPAYVRGDRDELIQVAQNLIQNAIKYGKSGGRVDVSVRKEGSRVALVVADDGIGIAPDHLPRLTERFYRVSAKDSRERGGTGLGLAIVKHIANRHRGDLKISSKFGSGTTVTVLLDSVSPSGPVAAGHAARVLSSCFFIDANQSINLSQKYSAVGLFNARQRKGRCAGHLGRSRRRWTRPFKDQGRSA